jgi:hypothetical protein
VWLLQGIGVLPGSFMTNDPVWAIAGLAVIVAAVGFVAWPRLRRSRDHSIGGDDGRP